VAWDEAWAQRPTKAVLLSFSHTTAVAPGLQLSSCPFPFFQDGVGDEATAHRGHGGRPGAFIDQSQSLNIHMDTPSFQKLTSLHFYAWSKVRTVLYCFTTVFLSLLAQARVGTVFCFFIFLEQIIC